MFHSYKEIASRDLDALGHSKKTKIKSTEYLYGCSATEWKDEPYSVALQRKIDKAKELLEMINDEYTGFISKRKWDKEYMSYLAQRQNDVYEAINFNILLLDETID